VQKLKKTMLQPQNMLRKFEQLKRKWIWVNTRYLRGTLQPAPLSWHENERKLFLGFFLTYSHLHFKKSSEIVINAIYRPPKSGDNFPSAFIRKMCYSSATRPLRWRGVRRGCIGLPRRRLCFGPALSKFIVITVVH
jgi:hypothetical protein